jgi:hypothetical protein
MPQKQLLHEQLGTQYINEWFADALFLFGGKLHRLRDINVDEANKPCVRTYSLSLTAGAPKWASDRVPMTAIEDFSTFKYPKLGYRQFRQGKIGNIVVQVSSIRAAQRGLRTSSLRLEPLPVYKAIDAGYPGEGLDNVNDARRAKEIFAPSFTPFSVGLKQLLDGTNAAFAVNEDLAVGIACVNDGSDGYNVYYRGRVVGTVDNRGNLTLTNKILQRESLKKKLFG